MSSPQKTVADRKKLWMHDLNNDITLVLDKLNELQQPACVSFVSSANILCRQHGMVYTVTTMPDFQPSLRIKM